MLIDDERSARAREPQTAADDTVQLVLDPDMTSELRPTPAEPSGRRGGRHERRARSEAAPAPEHLTFRPDIEGLRAVAIGLVLLFHAGLPFISGGYVGVDVFFVISGFLITTQLVNELEQSGRVSLSKFYARRAKRILPAAAVVLLATVVLVRLYIPKIRWEEIGGDILGSALYMVNWRLADRSVDYLAEDSQPSPVQHFWSLAVEEQFYLFWPLLVIIAGLVARALGARPRPILGVALVAVAAPSFAWAILETAHSPAEAFFTTSTRIWQLAVGAGVAIAGIVLVRQPRWLAFVIGWAGLIAVVASGLVFTTRTPWPGYAAALPTLGTAAVIAAGFAIVRGGPSMVLGLAPMRWIGKLSYSLYLWHWPLIIAATAYWGELSPKRSAAVVAISIVPAWISYLLIENPLRRSPTISRSPRLALSLGVNFTFLGVIAGLFITLMSAQAVKNVPVAGGPLALGAAVLADDPRDDPAGAPRDRVDFITPDPLAAVDDVPDIYNQDCHQNQTDAEVLSCVYGDPKSEVTVAVAGDSKIAQWLPALQVLADQNKWKMIVFTKSSCAFATAVQELRGPYDACTAWNRSLLDRLRAEKPDYLLTSQGAGSALLPDGGKSTEVMVAGMRESWSAVTEIGTKVIVFADNPHPGFNVYECADEHRTSLSECTYDRNRRDTEGSYKTQVQAVKGQANVMMIDLYDAICPTEKCAPVIGNVLVYRQGSHITATYVKTLTPRIATALTAAGLNADYRP